MENNKYYHSVTLDRDRCRGCINCIKRCPTEAIRVRNSKAKIIKERCIDCGECIRVCPHFAKKVVTDDFHMIEDYEYRVAMPAPTLYGQFKGVTDVNIVLTGLLEIGFDKVYEVAKAAELVTLATREYMDKNKTVRPLINSACPAVVRLIKVRFPSLIDNILPILAPVELAAILARHEAVKETGLPPEKIGIFFITPCAAKVTNIKNPIGFHNKLVNNPEPATFQNTIAALDQRFDYHKLGPEFPRSRCYRLSRKSRNPKSCRSYITGVLTGQARAEKALALRRRNMLRWMVLIT